MSVSHAYNRLKSIFRSELRNVTFRTNPEFELLTFDQLSTAERTVLKDLQNDPDVFAVARPRKANGLTAKAVCRRAAALMETLRNPRQLPQSILSELGHDAELTMTQLVFDGVLQITDGARWLSGPSACQLSQSMPTKETQTELARLSLEAIEYAGSFDGDEVAELARRLYQYHAVPLTPSWLRQLSDESCVARYLQIERCGRHGTYLERHWAQADTRAENSGWMAWSLRQSSPTSSDRMGFKMYFSPEPAALTDTFGIWLRAITEAGARYFKVGRNAYGLLRPDKAVAYFADWISVKNAARWTTKQLGNCKAQGVPFSAQFSNSSFVSWGSDPPSEEAVPVWLRRQSWRQWVVSRLALALSQARHSGDLAFATQFALERLRLDGVDTATWSPVATSWQVEASL